MNLLAKLGTAFWWLASFTLAGLFFASIILISVNLLLPGHKPGTAHYKSYHPHAGDRVVNPFSVDNKSN